MDFLKVSGKTFLVTGVANKKSVAFFVAKGLIDNGVEVIFSVQNEENRLKAQKLFPDSTILICNVESDESIRQLGEYFKENNIRLSGFSLPNPDGAILHFQGGPWAFYADHEKDAAVPSLGNRECFRIFPCQDFKIRKYGIHVDSCQNVFVLHVRLIGCRSW